MLDRIQHVQVEAVRIQAGAPFGVDDTRGGFKEPGGLE
jgi:hypothetical protein